MASGIDEALVLGAAPAEAAGMILVRQRVRAVALPRRVIAAMRWGANRWAGSPYGSMLTLGGIACMLLGRATP